VFIFYALYIIGRIFVHLWHFNGHACNSLNIKHIEAQNFQCLGLCWMVDVFHAKCGFWIKLVFI
jgi:hypothetical protein